jgi:hypothetical protein
MKAVQGLAGGILRRVGSSEVGDGDSGDSGDDFAEHGRRSLAMCGSDVDFITDSARWKSPTGIACACICRPMTQNRS